MGTHTEVETFTITKGEDAPNISLATPIGRKMASVRTVDSLAPIEGADAIEVAWVGGWSVVVKKNEFKPGDLAIYCEIDSWIPTEIAAFLSKGKEPREYEGIKGEKLRTIRLRKQLSQGLLLPLSISEQTKDAQLGDDVTEALGIVKWEATLPACLQGQALGNFPSWIRKTDQERCQNIAGKIFGYDEVVAAVGEWLDITVSKPTHGQFLRGKSENGDETVEWDEKWDEANPTMLMTHWKPIFVKPALDTTNDQYEVSMKLDGSSMTAFVRNAFTGEDGSAELTVGVCSRNLQLKINDENKDNTFVKTFLELKLDQTLLDFYARASRSIAIQGELMGPSIQGNREGFSEFKYFVFDIFDIDNGEYLAPAERMEVFKELQVLSPKLQHVPILSNGVTLNELGLYTVADLLLDAEGPSITHKVREGKVYKRLDGQFSFKAISNKFLENEKD